MEPSRSARVLVVDDDKGIRDFVSAVLREEGYAVEQATDGQDALNAVERSIPDLILLDLRMPRMDGWEFARTYRARGGRHAPIVIVTAALDVRGDARNIGADGFLAKPFLLEDLLAVVRRHAVRPI